MGELSSRFNGDKLACLVCLKSVLSLAIYVFCLSVSFASPLDDAGSLKIVNIEYWPGNGVSVDVVLHKKREEIAVTGDQGLLTLLDPVTEGVIPNRITQLKKASARIAIVVVPDANQQQQKDNIKLIRTLLKQRGSDELFGIYIYDGVFQLALDFTNDRERLLESLTRLEKVKPNWSIVDKEFDIAGYRRLMSLDPGAAKHFRGAVLMAQSEVIKRLAPQIRRVTPWPMVAISAEKKLTAKSVSQLLDNYKYSQHYRISFCNVSAHSKVEISLGGQSYMVELETFGLDRSVAQCDLDAIASNTKDYPTELYFSFNQQQKTAFEHIVKGQHRNNFNLSVQSEVDGLSYAAKAHLRGQSTLRHCKRKSYSLTLLDGQPKNLMPDSASNKFFLLALCIDPMNLRSHTGYELWQSLDLFPLRYRFIELFIDQISQGNYVILENPSTFLAQKLSQVSSVIRRDFEEPDTFPVVKYSANSETQALGDYVNGFMGLEHLTENEFITQITKILDLDQYLTHLAAAAILSNGDYIDELIFIRQPILSADGRIVPQYRIAKWDPDELFTPCHIGGKLAWRDVWGLAYCVESELGKQILSKPILYAKYVDKLEQLLNGKLSSTTFLSALEKTVKLVNQALQRDGVMRNMKKVNLDPEQKGSRQQAAILIREQADELIQSYQKRRELILMNIEKYRQAKAG